MKRKSHPWAAASAHALEVQSACPPTLWTSDSPGWPLQSLKPIPYTACLHVAFWFCFPDRYTMHITIFTNGTLQKISDSRKRKTMQSLDSSQEHILNPWMTAVFLPVSKGQISIRKMPCSQFVNVFDKFLEKVIHSSLLCFNEGTVEDHVDDIFVKPLLVNNFIWLLYSKSALVFEKNE